MIAIIKTFADGTLNTRTVHYAIGTTINYAFDFFTDCIKFHTKASGYEKYKGMETENNMNSMLGTETTKMQGYGNYEFKPDTNLFSFIDYCYSKEPAIVMACAYKAGTNEINSYDYTVLLSYRDRQVNNDYFKYFWQNMNNFCPNFKDYQDEFFFLKYTKPATEKIGINLAMLRRAYNDEESIKEYLTCLTSYIYSITPQAQVERMTFGKGDVVPFLYYKHRDHANIDVRQDTEALKDIAKYAYVALIEGWCTLPTPYHLWENEYNFLFGPYDRNDLDYDIETLHEWYDETYQKYCKDKGRKGNNLLGSDINHIIESDYSIEQQLEATEYYLRQVFNELGIDSDFKETMARNELMAKYMMQNSSFDETIKDYSITIKFMTENLQRGTQEEQNTHTVVTSDFQTLEFNYTMNRRFIEHSDEDGISDGAELGNEKWINITEFVKRTYEDAVRNGEQCKATFEEQVEDIIEKNGAYTDFNGNKVYGSVKWNDDKTKVLYRVYDYNSNPKLNDTDFDGLNDNADSKPIYNKFNGTSTGIGKVEYNQDFRWFYTNNKKYNDELAVMSLIMSNLCDGNTVITDQASGEINTYLSSIGFTNIQNIGEYGDNIYIAKKTVQYYAKKKEVIGVFLGKCERWYSDVIKYKENQKAQVVNTAYRESLESYIQRIINKVNLIATSDCSYWVAGYDVGGSIASEISAKLVDTGREVYCYTFGAFNTRESLDTKTEIKNIRNEDDFFVKYLTGTKPGESYGASIFEDLMFEYRDLTDSSDYKGNFIFTNYLLYVYDETEFLKINNVSDADRILADYFRTFNQITNQNDIENYADLAILLNKWKIGNEQAHSIKSYYVLAKSLNGFDILDGDGEKKEHYRKTIEQPIFEHMIARYINPDNGIETRGKGTLEDPYYSNNVYLGEFYFKIPKGKNKVYAKAVVNGAITLVYDLPNDFEAHIKSKNSILNSYDDINRNIALCNNGTKDFYKRGLLNDGNNEYLIEIDYVGTMDNNPRDVEVKLDFENCYDYKENRREFKSGIKWEASDDTIYPYVGKWQYNMSGIYYMPREVALTYYLGLNVSPDKQWLYNYLNSDAKISDCFSGFIDDSNFSKPLDVYGDVAGLIIDGVDSITDMVFKDNPVASGFSKGFIFTGRVAFSIVYPSSAIGIAEDILKFCLQVKTIDDLISQDYIDKVGECIYSYGIKDENGNTYITCEDSLCVGKTILRPFEFKEFTMSYDCMTWEDLRYVYGWKGVHGNFYE